MKRSNTVTLALMGTASFAASFVVGSAFLAWTRPAPPPAAAVADGSAASVPAGTGLRQTCTIGPDGTQSCAAPSSSSWTRVHIWGPAWLYPDAMRGSSATAANLVPTSAQALGQSRTGVPDGVARGGFGSTSRGMAHASAGA